MATQHCFTLRYPNIANILVTPIAMASPVVGYIPSIAKFQTQCIWDTGCSKTTITQEVVDALGLQPTGVTYVNTASEQNKQTVTYQIDLFLSSDLVFRNLIVNLGVIVKGVGCLLGMDIIGHGDLSLTSLGGKTCMSFRYPSSHEIDFVSIADRAKHKAQYPNDKCNCGNGKKFKDCHGKR